VGLPIVVAERAGRLSPDRIGVAEQAAEATLETTEGDLEGWHG
jgi:hypothetical protein